MTINQLTSVRSGQPRRRQPHRRQPRRGKMPRRRSSGSAPLGPQVGYYVLVLVLSSLTKFILFQVDVVLGLLGGIVVHLYAGYRLNRCILSRVKWHPQKNTLHNIAVVKLNTLIFWPLAYPIFFFQLWVVRYL